MFLPHLKEVDMIQVMVDHLTAEDPGTDISANHMVPGVTKDHRCGGQHHKQTGAEAPQAAILPPANSSEAPRRLEKQESRHPAAVFPDQYLEIIFPTGDKINQESRCVLHGPVDLSSSAHYCPPEIDIVADDSKQCSQRQNNQTRRGKTGKIIGEGAQPIAQARKRGDQV